jgi:hypothetical protein
MKHEHAEVIIAIAEGRDVECISDTSKTRKWEHCTPPDLPSYNPITCPRWEWRVRSIPPVRYECLQKTADGRTYIICHEEVIYWDMRITFEYDIPIKVEARQ